MLFDALERSLRGKPGEKLIPELYRGALAHQVRCLRCGYCSEREEEIYDVSVPVRGALSRVAAKPRRAPGTDGAVPWPTAAGHATLPDALTQFVAPELLADDNQYACAQCERKVDAHKVRAAARAPVRRAVTRPAERQGCVLRRLPHVLVVSLNRFVFDMELLDRVKVNDRMDFPLVRASTRGTRAHVPMTRPARRSWTCARSWKARRPSAATAAPRNTCSSTSWRRPRAAPPRPSARSARAVSRSSTTCSR